MIIPWHGLLYAVLSQPGGLWRILIPVLDHQPNTFERVRDDRSLWWTDDVDLPSQDKDSRACTKHAETQ